MNEKEIRATAPEDKPLRLGDLPIVKGNILEVARDYDKGVVGGYNGTFPLTAASKGGIYLLSQTGKFYVCETAYNGTQLTAPNSNFVELSVWKNHDRLDNLINIIPINENIIENKWYDVPYPANFTAKNSIVIPVMVGNTNYNYYTLKLNFERTKYSVANIVQTSSDFAFDLIFIKYRQSELYKN